MKIEHFKCFGKIANNGSEALLFTGKEISAITQKDRRKLAVETNANACVFMETRITDNMPILDFHYPHARSPLCLHAALAASYNLFLSSGDNSIVSAFTSWTGQYLSFRKAGSTIFVRVSPSAVPVKEFPPTTIVSLLNCSPEAIASKPIVASIGSPKMLVELSSKAELHSLSPNLEDIIEWGCNNNVNGIYTYVKTGVDEYEGRNFNHLDPLMEDVATGVAAGALTSALKSQITLHQGLVLGNICEIVTLISGDQIEIGGKVNLC